MQKNFTSQFLMGLIRYPLIKTNIDYEEKARKESTALRKKGEQTVSKEDIINKIKEKIPIDYRRMVYSRCKYHILQHFPSSLSMGPIVPIAPLTCEAQYY